jgi:hypothetical protein
MKILKYKVIVYYKCSIFDSHAQFASLKEAKKYELSFCRGVMGYYYDTKIVKL